MAKLKPTYFESLKQCSAMTGIPLEKLKLLKSEGCPAFRYSRVYHADLLAWIKNEGQQQPSNDQLPKSHWDREKARADYERVAFNLEVEKKKYLLLDEICASVGQMLSGFRTACNMLPGSAARWLVGLKDFHAIKARLESEMDGVLHALGRGRYLEDVAPVVIEKLFGDRTPEFRQDLLKCCERVFVEIGRECFRELQVPLDEEASV